MYRKLLFFGICFLITTTSCNRYSGRVYFIPTIHGLHKANNKYNYDSLKQIVSSLDPDIIAVEIRAEDIAQDSVYLSKNYPYEMRMMRSWFPEAIVLGFDWLGNDIEGKLIPANYWSEVSSIKKYEKELNADSLFTKQTSECDTFTKQRLEILKTYSLKDILKSNDSVLTKQFYNCLDKKLKGSIHERVLQFYDLRNSKLLENIKRIIAENKHKRIVILTGDDHFVFLKDQFQSEPLY
ncbi:MAG: DUF5694 domain-containing protein [Ferruginibacter sp.]